MADLHHFTGPNQAYVLGLYDQYLQAPDSVAADWREFFRAFAPQDAPTAARAAAPPAGVELAQVVGAHELAQAIRARGHTAAHLDPLAAQAPAGEPGLQPQAHGISDAVLRALPASIVGGPAAAGLADAAEAIARLRGLYARTTGYEFEHVQAPEERAWLRDAIESGRYAAPLPDATQKALLARLSEVEGFERYLHRAFFGQKRFSIEGTDLLVPILDEVVQEAGEAGARHVLVGMAHRGRLNVLAHVLRKPYEKILVGFQGAVTAPVSHGSNPDVPSGDVKYHMGWTTTYAVGDHQLSVTLSPNPSHLEFVGPVVVGMTRAAQDDTGRAGAPTVDPAAALAILVHGDAAFPGQGVVAETFNMSGLRGYTVGGTLHVIANNQVGFTTDPSEARSTRYASDLAKGFEVPVVHVNADDAEACLAVARLAHAYRARFHKDFVIDLVGYRRWGHNEGDEPLFTQPLMYETIRQHPTARERYARQLVERGVATQAEADALLQQVFERLDRVKASLADAAAQLAAPPSRNGRPQAEVVTAVPAARLRELNEQLLLRPGGFTPNPRLEKQLERRRDALGGEPAVDWGHAEALAFASLLAEGIPVRLTGQDAERGTFSHRHAVLSDARTGRKLNALAVLPAAKASLEIHNSPLSEMAIVGFEYGYSVGDPQALVLWEAQFGDFVNSAQVMIDQYISASYQKWEQTSGLVLLLPHGYEGQGPEHSSARLERFLQLAAENNLRIANCTSSAQFFHLLRRQALHLHDEPRPLVVMTPKSLLRHPLAASRLQDLSEGGFQHVIPEPALAERPAEITRLLLCSGKLYVDLVGAPAREAARSVGLVRVEELYPFPAELLRQTLTALPALQEIVWVQEEPKNMGAWSFVQPRLRELAGDALPVRYVGRPERASPAEGSPDRHAAEQARIVAEAWGDAPEPARDASRRKAQKA